MIEVNLSIRDINDAAEHQRFMDSLKGDLDSTIRGTKNFQAIGHLGEVAFKRYCDYAGIEYQEDESEFSRNGKDLCDLFVGNGKKVDVKSSRKYKGIVLNHNQYWKTKFKKIDMLVGVHFPTESLRTALIVGWGTWPDLVRDEDKDFIRENAKDGDKSGQMYSIPQEKLRTFKLDGITI